MHLTPGPCDRFWRGLSYFVGLLTFYLISVCFIFNIIQTNMDTSVGDDGKHRPTTKHHVKEWLSFRGCLSRTPIFHCFLFCRLATRSVHMHTFGEKELVLVLFECLQGTYPNRFTLSSWLSLCRPPSTYCTLAPAHPVARLLSLEPKCSAETTGCSSSSSFSIY